MASNSFIRFKISYRPVGEQKTDSLEFVLNNKVATNTGAAPLILEAVLPQDITTASRLFVSLILDDVAMQPEIPAAGFASLNDLYSWLQANWYMYGRWFITPDKLVLYLNAGLATKGTLTVTATARYVYIAAIPVLQPEEYYYVRFVKNGTEVIPAFPEDMATTMEDIVVWANQNWRNAGEWHIEDGNLILTAPQPADIELSVIGRLPGGFDFGFSNGFDT